MRALRGQYRGRLWFESEFSIYPLELEALKSNPLPKCVAVVVLACLHTTTRALAAFVEEAVSEVGVVPNIFYRDTTNKYLHLSIHPSSPLPLNNHIPIELMTCHCP